MRTEELEMALNRVPPRLRGQHQVLWCRNCDRTPLAPTACETPTWSYLRVHALCQKTAVLFDKVESPVLVIAWNVAHPAECAKPLPVH